MVGKNTTQSWEKDGVTHYRTKVVVNEITLLPNGGARGGSNQGGGQQTPPPNNPPKEDEYEDDLPF